MTETANEWPTCWNSQKGFHNNDDVLDIFSSGITLELVEESHEKHSHFENLRILFAFWGSMKHSQSEFDHNYSQIEPLGNILTG